MHSICQALQRSSLLRVVWFLSGFVLLAGNACAAADKIVYSHDLHKDGQIAKNSGVPLLVIFTSPDCTYCERVIQDFLLPMEENPEYAHKVLIRRIQITDQSPLLDWSGKPTTSKQYAAKLAIRMTPVVIAFLPDGSEAAEPLVGLGPEDYYGGYLDSAIDSGLAKMHSRVH